MVDVYALFILCGLVAVSVLQFDFWLKFYANSSLTHQEFTSKFLQIQGVTTGQWEKTVTFKKNKQKKPQYGLWSLVIFVLDQDRPCYCNKENQSSLKCVFYHLSNH